MAGFGRTGLILAGLALHALTIGDQTAAFTAFAVAALTIVSITAVLTLLIGTAQTRLTQTLRSRPQQIKRWGGAVLLLVGGWLLIPAIFPDSFAWLFPA